MVSNASEKSKEMTVTNGLDCSRLVIVCGKEVIAADVFEANNKRTISNAP